MPLICLFNFWDALIAFSTCCSLTGGTQTVLTEKNPFESSAKEGLNSGRRITGDCKILLGANMPTPLYVRLLRSPWCHGYLVRAGGAEEGRSQRALLCDLPVRDLTAVGAVVARVVKYHVRPLCLSCLRSVSFFLQVPFWEHCVLWRVSKQLFFWMVSLREKGLCSVGCRRSSCCVSTSRNTAAWVHSEGACGGFPSRTERLTQISTRELPWVRAAPVFLQRSFGALERPSSTDTHKPLEAEADDAVCQPGEKPWVPCAAEFDLHHQVLSVFLPLYLRTVKWNYFSNIIAPSLFPKWQILVLNFWFKRHW